MKWVTSIFYLFLVSFAKSEPLAAREHELGGGFHTHTDISPEDFKHVVLATFAQYVQRATFEEVRDLTNGIIELAKSCTEDERADEACGKQLGTVVTQILCHEEGLGDKYGFTECCGKDDEERKKCILSLKNETIPHYQRPSAEEACKSLHDDSAAYFNHFLYQIARRGPSTSILKVVVATQDFLKVSTTCCEEADKDSCFREKAPPIKQQVLKAIDAQKNICYTQKEFGKRMVTGQTFILLSQKFPKAGIPTILKIAEDISLINEKCCKGDTLECFLDRLNLTGYICSHQDEISSKLKGCCEKPILERRECFITVENDDKPEDLSPVVEGFFDNHLICPRYAEDQNALLAEFLYEEARRRPEASVQLMLRLGDMYEDLLEKCCKSETPGECFKQGEEFRKEVNNTLERANYYCDLQKHLGDDFFQKYLIVSFTRKAPQLLFEELNKFTTKFAEIPTKCCNQSEAQRLRCIEKYAYLVLGNLCQHHEEHPINKQIGRCCGDSYAFRLGCFRGLGVDAENAPVPFNPELFTFHADLCSADDLKEKEKRLFYNLVRCNPNITDQQLADESTHFTDLLTKCCKADNREECFTAESAKFVEEIQAEH